jgi:hypothetical protein
VVLAATVVTRSQSCRAGDGEDYKWTERKLHLGDRDRDRK